MIYINRSDYLWIFGLVTVNQLTNKCVKAFVRFSIDEYAIGIVRSENGGNLGLQQSQLIVGHDGKGQWSLQFYLGNLKVEL